MILWRALSTLLDLRRAGETSKPKVKYFAARALILGCLD